jgi:hypothetical protein
MHHECHDHVEIALYMISEIRSCFAIRTTMQKYEEVRIGLCHVFPTPGDTCPGLACTAFAPRKFLCATRPAKELVATSRRVDFVLDAGALEKKGGRPFRIVAVRTELL